MKIKMIVCSVLAMAVLTGCATEKYEKREKCEKCGKCEHHEKKWEKSEWRKRHEKQARRQAKLMAEAKISKKAAEQTALARVPNGTIKETELEKEHGRLIWSFDVATPGTREITEVNVDAKTGAVVSVSKELPALEGKEATEGKDKD